MRSRKNYVRQMHVLSLNGGARNKPPFTALLFAVVVAKLIGGHAECDDSNVATLLILSNNSNNVSSHLLPSDSGDGVASQLLRNLDLFWCH
ncbi:unnamed protein product [Toxocara canis]|uniref:Secreted protein n=1 Tax=Toxocara canis TaxID=6265 RepID=A0A183UZQ9_TOXCA|nr:unnamed protein product [Toxocara canis]